MPPVPPVYGAPAVSDAAPGVELVLGRTRRLAPADTEGRASRPARGRGWGCGLGCRVTDATGARADLRVVLANGWGKGNGRGAIQRGLQPFHEGRRQLFIIFTDLVWVVTARAGELDKCVPARRERSKTRLRGARGGTLVIEKVKRRGRALTERPLAGEACLAYRARSARAALRDDLGCSDLEAGAVRNAVGCARAGKSAVVG